MGSHRVALEFNIVPYHLPDGVEHWVLWYHPGDTSPKTDELQRDKCEADANEYLTRNQLALLQKFDSGFLLEEANRLTKLAGHGRLHKSPTEWIDIGASTGGFVRIVLDDWAPPIAPPAALCPCHR